MNDNLWGFSLPIREICLFKLGKNKYFLAWKRGAWIQFTTIQVIPPCFISKMLTICSTSLTEYPYLIIRWQWPPLTIKFVWIHFSLRGTCQTGRWSDKTDKNCNVWQTFCHCPRRHNLTRNWNTARVRSRHVWLIDQNIMSDKIPTY